MGCCPSCGSDLGLRVRHLQMVRGQTLSVTHVVRDAEGRTRDLTDATAYVSVRADRKVAATFKLTSENPAPEGFRNGIVFADQDTDEGELTFTFVPADTEDLVALGHDDPWFYDLVVEFDDGEVAVEIAPSVLAIFDNITQV